MLSGHEETHQRLIDIINALGYKYNAVHLGKCTGFTMMALRAFLSGDLDHYYERYNYLFSTPDIVDKIKNLSVQVALMNTMRQELTERNTSDTQAQIDAKKDALNKIEHEVERLVDIIAYLDGVVSFQDGNEYEEFYGTHLKESYENELDILLASHKLEQKGGIAKVDAWIGIYDQDELKTYLQGIDDIAQNNNQDIGLVLSANNHRIGVFYKSDTKNWYIFDANKLPSLTFPGLSIASRQISHSVGFNITHPVAFRTIVYCAGNNKNEMEKLINDLKTSQNFQDTHRINKKRSKFQTLQSQRLVHLAALYEFDDVITQLAAVSANLSVETDDGFSADFFAVKYSRIKVMEALIKAGRKYHDNALAYLTYKNTQGQTLAHLAALDGKASFIVALHEAGMDLTEKDNTGMTPIRLAMRLCDVSVFRELHKAGFDLTQADSDGLTLAHYAAYSNQTKIILEFNRLGINLAKSVNGKTPAHIAVIHSNEAVVAALAQAGRDTHNDSTAYLSSKDINGDTLMHEAVRRGSESVIMVLRESGLDVNAENKDGVTPIRMAVSFNDPAMIDALLKAGAKMDLTFRNSQGKNALDMITKYRKEKIDNSSAELKTVCNSKFFTRKSPLPRSEQKETCLTYKKGV